MLLSWLKAKQLEARLSECYMAPSWAISFAEGLEQGSGSDL